MLKLNLKDSLSIIIIILCFCCLIVVSNPETMTKLENQLTAIKEKRQKPDKDEVKVDIVKISDGTGKQNYRLTFEPLYATSDIIVSDADYQKLNDFDTYIEIVQNEKGAYQADQLFVEDPFGNTNKSVPMAFQVSSIDLTKGFTEGLSDYLGISEDRLLQNDGISEAQLLLLTDSPINFQPTYPGLVSKDVTFSYRKKKITTSMWFHRNEFGKQYDHDYIFLSKEYINNFFEKNPRSSVDLRFGFTTFDNHGFGFVTENYHSALMPVNASDYVAVTENTIHEYINNSTLYITITNEKTKQEKTFRKNFSNQESDKDLETLVRLVTGNWDYTYNH